MPSSGGTSSSTVAVSVSDSVSAGAAVLSCTSATGTVSTVSFLLPQPNSMDAHVRPVSRNTASFFILVPLFLINRRMRETEIHTQDIQLPARKSVKRLCVTQL